jgi:hypothetical protein
MLSLENITIVSFFKYHLLIKLLYGIIQENCILVIGNKINKGKVKK